VRMKDGRVLSDLAVAQDSLSIPAAALAHASAGGLE
jgi:hypothetical protein